MFPGPLRAFHETIRNGSIRKASERLGLAPSSVSRQIAVLETLMGTSLLNRSLSGVALTHAGQLVAEYAQATVMDFDTLRLDLDDLKGSRGLVRVALVESIVSGGPIRASTRFREAFSEVQFEFDVMPATAVLDAVRNKTADIGITFCAEPAGDIVHEATVVEPLMLVISKDHPLAGTKELTLDAIGDLALALPDRKFGFRRLLDRSALAHRVTIAPVIVSNSFEALRDFARSGGGATILPLRAIATPGAGSLVGIPLAHEELSKTTVDVIRLKQRRMPRIIRQYLEMLRKTLEEPV